MTGFVGFSGFGFAVVPNAAIYTIHHP